MHPPAQVDPAGVNGGAVTRQRALGAMACCLAAVLLGVAGLAVSAVPGALRNAASEPEDVGLLLAAGVVALGAGVSCLWLGIALWDHRGDARRIRRASTTTMACGIALMIAAGLSALAGGGAAVDALVLAALAMVLGACAWSARRLGQGIPPSPGAQ